MSSTPGHPIYSKPSEADTCRMHVTPKLVAAGWDADHGTERFSIPEILEVPPISEYGNVSEIVNCFGGVQQLRSAVNEMQRLLYAA